MSYQVLARKWRPHRFSELVGQEHVVRPLVNALNQDRLHHAFLFTGTRGVGKTTIARILAKSLNCERGVSAEPCGVCSACQDVDAGRFVDLIEVDAASRTKVEDTRELLENVQYAPSRGRYKVYLIDEVHMLSNHSFNALLKTLEEPPPHIKFLLATTDPQRLPITVLSRCLQFSLKRLPARLIADHLAVILRQEGISYEAAALGLIARAGEGSMRDALSLLDQAIAFGGGSVGLAAVSAMLGTIDQRRVIGILDALAQHDARAVLQAVEELDRDAPDYLGVLAELLSWLQRIALAQVLPEAIADDSADPEAVRRLAAALSAEEVQLFYQIALIGRRDLPLAPEPRAGFEMVLLRMLCFLPAMHESGVSVADAPPPGGLPRPAREVAPAPVAMAGTAESKPGPISAVQDADWNTLLARFKLIGMAQQLARHCELKSFDGATLYLLLDPVHVKLRTEQTEQRLKAALDAYYGKPIRLRIDTGTTELATPARAQDQQRAERRQAAVELIEQDPKIRVLQETFGARIHPDSIAPTD
ncbi:MAG: DNA polymerase III subunit gamma/tau [Gammaproteobacteria bacterium]